MPKIAPSAAASRRARILDAARHCFALHGIHVSVDEICQEAGISKGAFYVYFKSKEAAIQALAEDHSRIVHEFAEMDSPDKLARMVADLTTARSTASKRLELETWTHALKVPALRSALWRNIDEMRRSLELGLRKAAARDDGRPSPVADQTAAEILTIFALGLIAWSALGEERVASSGDAGLRSLLALLLGNKAAAIRGRRRPAKPGRRPARPKRPR